MATTSNLYAEKVFAEQPIALWALDEPIDYISLLDDTTRDISNWSHSSNATITTDSPSEATPVFAGSIINRITVSNILVGESATIELSANTDINDVDLDLSAETIAISTYLYSPTQKDMSVEIGYEYTVGPSSTVYTETATYYFTAESRWTLVSDSFLLPVSFNTIKPIINISYSGPTTGYYFLIHGTTFGQHSENFNIESLGQTLEANNPFVTNIGGYTIEANAYGLQSTNGYYVSDSKKLFAKNSAMPMVYGSTSSTRITRNPNGPSLVIPGFGFMNEDGQYKDFTFEAWLRIQSHTPTPKRILGSVGSEDGVYVHDAFLTLRVDGQSGSYFVGEWDRPMLLAIRMSETSASLVVNGEEVVSLTLDPAQVILASKEFNWIGFYAYADVPYIDIDCVGIYPYIVPNIVEKRRWVYGQAIGIPEAVGSNDVGTTIIADYTVAKYAKNYLYPDMGSWNQGILENLITEGQRLSLPKYELPEVVFKNKLVSDWYKDLATVQQEAVEFLSLQPNSLWQNSRGYLSFSNNSPLNNNGRAFYALIESDSNMDGNQVIFIMKNEVSGESLSAILNSDTLTYTLSYLNANGTRSQEEITSVTNLAPGSTFGVGIDIESFSKSFGSRVSAFFGSRSSLKLYVGGDPDEAAGETFSGNIYRIGFCTQRNFQKISDLFTTTGVMKTAAALESTNAYNGGTPSTSVWDQVADGGVSLTNSSAEYGLEVDGGGIFPLMVQRLLDHVGSYNIVPKTFVGNFTLDIAVNGYWQDYVPLSHFAKTVDGGGGKLTRGLDFIQFNIGYPQISKIVNHLHDTSGSTVKTYVSFQYLKDTSTANPAYHLYTSLLPDTNVVSPGTDWLSTKYEVVNDSVIYMPPNVNVNSLALVLHIEVLATGIQQTPIKLQTVQLSSRAHNAFSPNAVGTKMGVDIYPYKKTGEYFDYKGKNPFSVYKGHTPHLYLTSTSGFRLRDIDADNLTHGFSIPINQNAATYYAVSAWQLMMRYDQESFTQVPLEVFEVKSKDRYIKFYLQADSITGQRGMLFAIDAETGYAQDVSFYVNGRLVKNPLIELHSWTTIGIVFNFSIDFSSTVGAFNVTGPILFNNVSHYQSSKFSDLQGVGYRKWSGVLGDVNQWNYWLGTSPNFNQWRDVLFTKTSEFTEVDGTQIYRKLTGADRFIVDTDSVFAINDYRYLLYEALGWQSVVVTSA
jgi:hypothetical protein